MHIKFTMRKNDLAICKSDEILLSNWPTGLLCMLFVVCYLFSKSTFLKKIFQEYNKVSKCGSKSGLMFLNLICVQTVWKCYQQTILAGEEETLAL